jgi:hypothetical protein
MPLVGDPVAKLSSAIKFSSNLPDALKPFASHGLNINWQPGAKQVLADCPFCNREGKFSIEALTGRWQCFVCNAGNSRGGGNAVTFLRELWKLGEQSTKDYAVLAKQRKLEYADTLVRWGAVRSPITGEWLLPAYGPTKQGTIDIKQLYRYTHSHDGALVLAATWCVGHQLYGADLWDSAKNTVYLCEGPWDAMRLWEVLRTTKTSEFGLVPTASNTHNLLSTANVLAVPGCKVFFENWLSWFKDRTVYLLYDNDYPRTNQRTGATMVPAGLAGMRRAASFIGPVARTVHYLQWGADGYDPALPDGFDLRDALQPTGSLLGSNPQQAMQSVINRVTPIPNDWHSETTGAVTTAGAELMCRPCSNYKELIVAWRKALKWTPGLDHALAVMLASIASTPSVGDQLWIKIVGPASCGKSTLSEAISVNRKYIVAKSSIRGFHSGFKLGDDTDYSLIASLHNRTLIIKDGDTLLQSPNLPQILSEGRDIYDGTSRTHYRNSVSREYAGLRMTWLLCGTASLRSIDNSELGERFLDCVIMERIDEELEDEIAWRAAHRAERSLEIESNGDGATQDDPEMVYCKELTGGYVDWVRDNAGSILPTIECSDDAKRQCIGLGKFVAYMRARPSVKQEEHAERELAARLVSQHVRLAKCLAFVLNRSTVDIAVMRRVRRVSLDTARGTTLDIVRLLSDPTNVQQGLTPKSLESYLGHGGERLNLLLRFLRAIGVVVPANAHRYAGAVRWRLTSSLRKLYKGVMDG